MSLLVVGSVAFDGIETPYGKHDRLLGGAASYFALAACHFAPVRLVGIVGDDFTAKDVAVFKHRHIDLTGARARHRENFLLGRPLQPEHERAHHAGHRPQRLREFSAHSSGIVHGFALHFSGQYRSDAAALRSEASHAQAKNRRPGHHELLDRAHSRGAQGNAASTFRCW